jgi:hypothetical protein
LAIFLLGHMHLSSPIRVFTEFRTFFHFRKFRMLYGISKNSAELYGIPCRGISYTVPVVKRNYAKLFVYVTEFFKDKKISTIYHKGHLRKHMKN